MYDVFLFTVVQRHLHVDISEVSHVSIEVWVFADDVVEENLLLNLSFAHLANIEYGAHYQLIKMPINHKLWLCAQQNLHYNPDLLKNFFV